MGAIGFRPAGEKIFQMISTCLSTAEELVRCSDAHFLGRPWLSQPLPPCSLPCVGSGGTPPPKCSNKATAAKQVDAAAMHVVHKDESFTRHFGKATSDNAMFLLGSISKPINVTAVMTLFDQGKFHLDDRVKKFLPSFTDAGRDKVTIRHLLTHVSGLPDQLPNNNKLRKQHAPLTTFAEQAIPYADPAHELQVLDVYSPKNAKNLPVVFWIHGGGWQTGDKTDVQIKPQAFMDKGFVFVSTNYRLLPSVDMATIVRDVAKSIRWVQDHIAGYGGDPKRLFIMGHSAGAQLAALICTDERYLKAEGLSLAITKGCVPVDGDTYDVPAIIETAETRWRVHGLPKAKFGHREKFGKDPGKHRDFSAVTPVAKGKGIPPFLILHVAGRPDSTAQARRLGNVLRDAGVAVTVFGAQETTHTKINADLGKPDDPATTALLAFLDKARKK